MTVAALLIFLGAPQIRLAMSSEPPAKRIKVEDVDGSYDCQICLESLRSPTGVDAFRCTQCSGAPYHRACAGDGVWERTCPTCKGDTILPWTGPADPHPAWAVATPAAVMMVEDDIGEDAPVTLVAIGDLEWPTATNLHLKGNSQLVSLPACIVSRTVHPIQLVNHFSLESRPPPRINK